MKGRSLGLLSVVVFGYALLYIPIVSVVIYSFNDSRLVTLWGGFSLRWYASLLEDEKLLEAALLSLRIAFLSATFATALGAIVALALHRLMHLRGRLLLSGMVTAPLPSSTTTVRGFAAATVDDPRGTVSVTLRTVNATAKAALDAILESGDRVKFARDSAGPAECRAAVEEAYRLVDITKPLEARTEPVAAAS